MEKVKLKETMIETNLEIFETIHRSLANGIRAAKAQSPRDWLAKKGLSVEVTGACFNSGQIHHRKEQAFKDALESMGFLTRSNVATNAGQIPYTCFGNFSVMFPLRSIEGKVENFFAISLKNNKEAYLNEEGIYPAYPHELTKKLFITDTILDAATLLESKVMDNREAIIALHDGLIKEQHKKAIARLKELSEIIYIQSKK